MDDTQNIEAIFSKEIGSLVSRKFLLAFSGGVDSVVLLDLLVNVLKESDALRIIHINHNLNEHSNDWAQFSSEICEKYDLPLICESVEPKRHGKGLEADARELRYQSFRDVIQDDEYLLTGHHQDDQMETLLYRIFRGTGIDGLRAIRREIKFGKGFLYRPMLNISREKIEEYAQLKNLKWIYDSSNDDSSYDRNFLRKDIIPLIKKRWPSVENKVSRLSVIAEQNQLLLNELAIEDVGQLKNYNHLDIETLSEKSYPRIINIFRFMIKKNNMNVPSMQVLNEGIKTLMHSKSKSPSMTWNDNTIRRYKHRLYFLNSALNSPNDLSNEMSWDIKKTINLGKNLGSIQARFLNGEGISLNRCPSNLAIKYRKGGEEIKPSGHKITKSLKNLFQENNVLPWVRDKIPLIYVDQELISVGDLWFNQDFKASANEDGFLITWDKKIDVIHNS
jgi:tRNA(Ile)-lysidine synthase